MTDGVVRCIWIKALLTDTPMVLEMVKCRSRTGPSNCTVNMIDCASTPWPDTRTRSRYSPVVSEPGGVAVMVKVALCPIARSGKVVVLKLSHGRCGGGDNTTFVSTAVPALRIVTTRLAVLF